MTTKNNSFWLNEAAEEAKLSPDPSRKIGCIITINALGSEWMRGRGHNDFPKGVTPRLERPEKYTFIEHAERNAIYESARVGAGPLQDATIYLTWFPCTDCARAIVQSGIKKLVGFEPDWTETRYGFNDARAILEEGGVEIVFEGKN